MATYEKNFLDLDGLRRYNDKIKNRFDEVDFTISDESLAREDADVILQNQINSLTSGAPIPVSSTSGMTDTTKIYVNTTDGNWYFYNGSNWVVGGVYQASQSTDDVEGLIYNQVNYNLKYLCNFEIGSLNTDTGATIVSQKYIRTSDYLVFSHDLVITPGTNTKVLVLRYQNDGTFINSYWQANPRKMLYIAGGTRFKLLVQYDVIPEGGAPDLTDVESSFLFSDIQIMPYSLYIDSQIRDLNAQGLTMNPDNLKYYFNFIVGDRNNNEISLGYSAYTRLTNINIVKAEEDLIIPHNTVYDIYLRTYSSYAENSYISGSWQDLTTNDLVISKGTFFTMVITSHPHGNISTETILYNAYDNPIFKSLEIYKANEVDIDSAINNLKSDISLKSIDSKYNDETISTSKITDYMVTIGSGKCDNYIFFTDPHTMGSNGTYNNEQNNKYLSVLQKYYYRSPANFIVCGGDWLNTGDTPAQAKEKLSIVHGVCNYLFGGQIYQIIGNHDTNEYGADYERISQQTVANILNDNHGKNYYTFESANARYYILDTDTDASTMGTYRWEQIDWLGKNLIEHDNEHNVLMFHVLYPLHPNDSSRTAMANNLDSLINAYNAHTTVTLNNIPYDFSGCTGRIDYSLVGHSHQDFVETLGGVPVIATINLRSNNNPSFDLISVDYTNMKLYATRVGQGTDRQINI